MCPHRMPRLNPAHVPARPDSEGAEGGAAEVCAVGQGGGPADRAGLKPGDRLVSYRDAGQ